MIAEKQTNDSLAVQIADQVVPEYRAKGAAYSCSGHTSKRWSAAHDAALIALQRSALSQPADDLRRTAQAVIDGAFSTYKSKNGRDVSIQADDGEKCLIVHSDLMQAMEAALSQPAPAPQPADDLRAAAAGALASLDSFMSGAPINPKTKAQSDALARAASFASEAYRQGYDHDQATHAMLRAFLTALVDPLHPDLDYLRADAAAGATARAALSQNGGAVVEDAPEPIGNCESCGVDIHEGDKCCHTTDGCVLCVEHAPMLSDVLRQMDEVLEKGEADGCYDLTEDELREDRDSIAADIAKNGDRKAVSR